MMGKLLCSDLEDSCHRRLQCLYIGTLETFIEERETIRETEPYQGGNIDGKDTAPELGVWELDLRSQFSVLFISHKETRTKVPRSEIVEKCTGRRFQRAESEQHQFQVRFFREPKESSCATQARQCSLAFFPDSFFLNKFSSQAIVESASLSF